MNSEQKDKILRGLGIVALILFLSSVAMAIIGFWDKTAQAIGFFYMIIGWILFGVVLFARNRRKKKQKEKEPFSYIGDDPENRMIDY